MKKYLAHIYLFLRAFLIVLFVTSNVYLIANKFYIAVIFLSAGISLMWTLNVKAIAISNWQDRIVYILGSVTGTAVSLYLMETIVSKL